jgi:2-keto-3-deoxy-6-phosphogluconate aldolase
MPDEKVYLERLREPPECVQYGPEGAIYRGDLHDWPAVAARAAGIRTEIQERASAHGELWERLEILILNALENRTPDQNQFGD